MVELNLHAGCKILEGFDFGWGVGVISIVYISGCMVLLWALSIPYMFWLLDWIGLD